MNDRIVMRSPEWTKSRCPLCYKYLGKIEIVKREVKKKCKCKNCGEVIDERHIVW